MGGPTMAVIADQCPEFNVEVVDLNEYCELNQRDDGDNAKFMVGY